MTSRALENQKVEPRTEVAGLECDHCGGTAVESATGMFCEGDADRCRSCNFPGVVSVDDRGDEDENVAEWKTNDWDEGLKCNSPTCDECRRDYRDADADDAGESGERHGLRGSRS